MPAVAWLLVLAALGLATLAQGAWRKAGAPADPENKRLALGGARVAGAAVIALLFWRAQARGCATRSGSSAARAATSAISTSSRAAS
jgi:hypothetical protein